MRAVFPQGIRLGSGLLVAYRRVVRPWRVSYHAGQPRAADQCRCVSRTLLRLSVVPRTLHLHHREVVLHRPVEMLVGHLGGAVVVHAVVADLEQQVAGMAEAERPVGLLVVRGDQIVDRLAAIGHAQLRAHHLEQPAELVLARVDDLDLVGNAPQERLVDQFARLEVRREDHQLVEGHLDLLAVGQVEEVVAFLQRHDPAVQQLVDPHPLAAEVVDHQRAAVALQLQRRLADAGRGVDRHFQLRHGQLAAGDDRRPADADPALVDLPRSSSPCPAPAALPRG